VQYHPLWFYKFYPRQLKWEVLDIPVGTVIENFEVEGIRVLVMRGPASLCAYVGVPENHFFTRFNYDEIPLECHGGLSFSNFDETGLRPKGYYWFGWDYAHFMDAITFKYEEPLLSLMKETGLSLSHGKEWTIEEVKKEATTVAYQLSELIRFYEKIEEKLTVKDFFRIFIKPFFRDAVFIIKQDVKLYFTWPIKFYKTLLDFIRREK
jgi:hypothetical protein